MERYQRARDRTVGQMKAIQQFSGTIQKTTTLEAIQIREEQFEKYYKDFSDYELELIAFEKYEPITEEIDEMYLNTMATLKAAIKIRSQPQEKNVEVQDLNATLGQFIGQQQSFLQGMNQNQSLRLPKINIEPFDGDYKIWPSFHDLYMISVHENKGLRAVHKMQILNGLLKGDAAALIRHIKVTDQNYEEAWAKLMARYDKPKSVVCSLIELFLGQRNCAQANHKDLRKLCDTSDEVIRGLRTLGELAETRDPWLVHILLSKVDVDTRQLWAKDSVNDNFPTVDKFLRFLNTRCDPLESCMVATKPTSTEKKIIRSYYTTQSNKWNCIACQKDHFLYKCPMFKSMNVENRTKLIENSNSCTNCLRTGHVQSQCFSRAHCLICKNRHHSLLHKQSQATNLHTTTESTNDCNTVVSQLPSISTAQNHYQSTNNEILQSTLPSPSSTYNTHISLHENETPLNTLLPTALIYIESSNGQQMLARALLDSGSQSSFISESCVQRLGLRRKYSNISIYGLASCSAGKTRGQTVLAIKSRIIPHYTIKITTHIIEKISSLMPATMINIPKDSEIWQLELADPYFNRPNQVDLLIGAEFFLDILEEQKMSIPRLPALHLSKFGWLIAGKISQDNEESHYVQSYNVNIDPSNQENLMELLKRFWKVEEPLDSSTQTNEEDACENYYRSTTTRAPDARLIVRLPFLDHRPELGDSLTIAKLRMKGIEERFIRSEDYHKEYNTFIEEYIALVQMKPIPWSKV